MAASTPRTYVGDDGYWDGKESTMTTTPTSTNPYLSGNYGPVLQEVTATAAELTVTGTIPAELNGRYVRNGPNPLLAPDPDTYHWFVGDGMLHGLRLRDGRAEWYRNRWIRSGPVARALGEDPRSDRVHGGMDFGPNTNVIGHAGRTLALVEAGAMPYEVTGELETIGPYDFGGTLSGGYTAHPKKDPGTGELIAVSYYFGWGNDVEVTVISPEGRVTSSRKVAMGASVSLHDCAITPRYIVLYDLPVAFDMDAAMSGASFPYRWFDDYHARIGLLPRNGGEGADGADGGEGADGDDSADGGDSADVVWHDVNPCYVFHTLNAFDDIDGGAGITLDVVRHPSMFRTSFLGPAEGTPTLQRWRVDGRGGPVKEEQLDDHGQEFPRTDERRLGLPYRYGYGVFADQDADAVGTENGIIRHDLVAGTSEVRRFGPTAQVGEAVFVPRSGDADESDGWLMALVYEGTTDVSSLYILNAEDLSGSPQAVITLPQRVPVGFHGNWIPD
jgi:carotenoid cleavage dioxygenase